MAEPFVIYGEVRSGTNYIIDQLKAHPEIQCWGELFNYDDVGRQSVFVEGCNEAGIAVPGVFPDTPDAMFTFLTNNASTKLVGCKVVTYQLARHPDLLMAFRKFRPKAIVLTRRNRLRHMASVRLSHQTGEWANTIRTEQLDLPESNVLYNDPPPVGDYNRLFSDVFYIEYETIISDPDALWWGLLDFFNISNYPRPVPRIQQQELRPLPQIVRNYFHLKEKMVGTQHLVDFEDRKENIPVVAEPQHHTMERKGYEVRGDDQQMADAFCHRHGWSWVVHHLKKQQAGDGFLIDTFLERTFLWGQKPHRPYERPWIGIAHQPMLTPPSHRVRGESAEPLYYSEAFIKSLPWCAGLFALTEHHAWQIRKIVDVPVMVLRHPTVTDVPQFDVEDYLTDSKLVNVGWYLRHMSSFYEMEVPYGVRKLRIVDNHTNPTDYYRMEKINSDGRIRDEQRATVEEIGRLEDNEYDELLTHAIIFVHLYDACANNTVVEAIARGNPIVVNRLPGTEEYLGADYPFLYDRIEDVKDLIADPEMVALAAAKIRERQHLVSIDRFMGDFKAHLASMTATWNSR